MMNRKEIKEKAKEQLGRQIFGEKWLMGLLVCVIVAAISGLVGGLTSFIGGIGGLVIMGPLAYGLSYIFLKQSRDGEKMQIADLFSGFTGDFLQNFLIGLMIDIFVALWSLLFVIPGIVKYYAYSMAYYIKADHPEYDWRQCINESKALTKGHKGELFVLDLSFLGWLIVGALCLGVGTLWVAPYMAAAKSQFYQALVSATPAQDAPAAADATLNGEAYNASEENN